MNLEVIKQGPHETSNGIESSNESRNFRRLLSLSNKGRSTESRLSQPRPSVWTLKDIQKVIPKQGPTSLFILKENNPIRKYARLVAESKVFEYFILLTILLNCVVLAIDEPLPENDMSEINEIAQKMEYYFLGIFCFEAVVKIVAMGFVLHPKSYLRSGWNIVDFIVVVTGFATLNIDNSSSGNVNIKALRAVRVLRPLKLISGIPSLQVVMTSIVRAMLPLLQVLFLVVFVIIIYAIIGLEFLKGRFRYACFNKSKNEWESPQVPCDYKRGSGYLFIYGRACPPGYVCQRGWTGPNGGITSFDNIFKSMLTVFQCITMEGWTEIMYTTFYAIDEHGYIYSIYYVSLIVIGSFFMLNLVLGVLSGEFAKEREKVENRRSFLKLRKSKQIERQYNGYLEWLMKGEEVMTLETSDESNTPSGVIRDRMGDAALNPAIVFTSNRYRFNASANHRKSKFDRIKTWIKNSRIRVRVFVKHNAFYWTVLVVVFLNTCIMATNHYNQPKSLTKFQDTSEVVFVTIFTAEMLLKLYGLGPSLYFHSMFNIFDCVVVNVSILELIISTWYEDFNLGLSVMRSLRLLRIFKVTKYWSSLRNLISSLMNGMKSILSLMFLLFLFIVISALLGMQLFGGKFTSFGNYPRTNFDTFPDSLLAVFQIMTGEDWNAVMYNGINAYKGPNNVTGLLFSLYFIFLVVFGNYTLLNVFLAIAVDNLTNAEILSQDEEDEYDALKRQRSARSGLTGAGTHWTKLKALSFVRSLQRQIAEDEALQNGGDASVLENSATIADGEKIRIAVNGFLEKNDKHTKTDVQKKWNRILQKQYSVPIVVENTNAVNEDQNKNIQDVSDGSHIQPIENGAANSRRGSNVSNIIKEEGLLNVMKTNVAERRRMHKPNPALREVSLYIFTQENPIRRFCHAVVSHRFFDPFIMFVIFVSSLTLAIEDPVDDNNKKNKVLHWFDYVFAAIFSIEVVLKVIDVGLILHKGAYLRNYWNVLDAFVVACNIASLIVNANSGDSRKTASQTVKALRVLRVFRPLRAISKVKKLKAVFQCMVFSLKNVAFVLIITLLFLFIFACIGVQLFKGKFYHCTDESKMTKTQCQGYFYQFPTKQSVLENKPNVVQRVWQQYDFHFDNVFEAMLTLYTSSTGEGWPTSMHRTIDATKQNQGPIRNNKPYLAIYFVTFVIVFTFMIINIYVALIILTFQRQGEKELTEGGLDRNQRDCIHFALTSKPKPRYMPQDKHSFSYRVWYVVDSRPFEYCIMLFIVLNTLQLMMQYDESSTMYQNVLQGLNITFTVLFCCEAAMKIIAYRLSYFKDGWNLFDFFVVLGSVLDIVLTLAKLQDTFIDPSMFRLCRAARIVKLLRSGASIRLMLWTFLQSFKALPYVTVLILLLFYMYAVIGMQLFGKIKLQTGSDAVITEYNNFRTIIQALQILFRSATGENWNLIMQACYTNAPCDEKYTKPGATCGNKYVAIFYFGTFIFLCMFLLLNLFVAIIMDNFEYLTRDSSILGPHHLDEFVRVWSEYDPGASGRIHHQQLYTLMCHMAPPVGFGKKCPKSLGYKRLIRMNMPVGGDQTVTFHSTLFALIRTGLDIKIKGNMFKNDQELRRAIKIIWPKMPEKNIEKILPKQTAVSGQQMTVGKIYCVKLLVTNYRTTKSKEDNTVVEEAPVGTPSVFKRIISSFRRGAKQRYNEEEAIELKSKSHDKIKKARSASLRRSDNKGQQQLTKEGRRRSSWHDLGSFFRQKEGPIENSDTNQPSSEATDPAVQSQSQGAQAAATVIQNRNTTSRDRISASNSTGSNTSLQQRNTTSTTASQMTPSSRHHPNSHRQQDMNRNATVHFNTSRHQPLRNTGPRGSSGHSSGKPVSRSLSAGAVDYQRSGLSNYRVDHRSGPSPSHNRISASSGKQHFSNVPTTASSYPSMHGHSNNLSMQHSMNAHQITSPSPSQMHMSNNLSASMARSAPAVGGSPMTEHRPQQTTSQGKSGMNIWHSGPPFYGPPSSVDPHTMLQGGRPISAPKLGGTYSSNPHLASAHSQAARQGSSRSSLINSNDAGHIDNRMHDRSQMPNHPPATSNGMPNDLNRNQGKFPRSANHMVPGSGSYEEEEDILNGRQTQQYYDKMIAQINDKIAKAVERGQSPYAVYVADDDEENDWC